MKTVCVIGHPIKHSRSPIIHGYWLDTHGINARYVTNEVTPENLGVFLQSLPTSEFSGCNITLPHKETAISYIDHIDERARRVGSINTVYMRDQKTYATSTDGQGFVQNIKWRVPQFDFNNKHIVIIGAGGSTRSIVDELIRENVAHIIVANRTIEKAEHIAAHFGSKVSAAKLDSLNQHFKTANLVINTTSAGISNGDALDLPLKHLAKTALVSDINYVPLITPLLQTAESLGLKIVPGLGMLLHQAVRGFELWFGQTPTVDQALYDLVARDINPSYRP